MQRALPPGLPPADPCGAARTCVHIQIFSYGMSSILDGNGTVTSSPAGVDCHFVKGDNRGGCDVYIRSVVDGSLTITLTARPDPGSTDRHECMPAGCSVTFTGTSNYFEMDAGFRLDRHTLTVAKSGSGTGSVTSVPSGIDCGATCQVGGVPYGTSYALIATPQGSSTFVGWTGACSGQAACVVSVTSDATAVAMFALPGNTGGGGGPAAPPAAPPATPPAATDRAVDAQLLSVRTARSKLGARIVQVELTADEAVSVDVSLQRGTKTIAARHVSSFAAQDGTVVLPVARTTKAGAVVVQVKLTDAAGNASTVGRTVQLPRLAVKKHTKHSN
jgi:hypothetical protein